MGRGWKTWSQANHSTKSTGATLPAVTENDKDKVQNEDSWIHCWIAKVCQDGASTGYISTGMPPLEAIKPTTQSSLPLTTRKLLKVTATFSQDHHQEGNDKKDNTTITTASPAPTPLLLVDKALFNNNHSTSMTTTDIMTPTTIINAVTLIKTKLDNNTKFTTIIHVFYLCCLRRYKMMYFPLS